MRLRKAKLIRTTTLDGWDVLREGVPLGREYLVDLDSIKTLGHADPDHLVPVMRKFIFVYNDEDSTGRPLGWFPLEMLEVLDDTPTPTEMIQ